MNIGVRMFVDPMESYWALDFYDTEAKRPINTPKGLQLWPDFDRHADYMEFPARLLPVHETAGYSEVPEGTERYYAAVGSYLMVVRSGDIRNPLLQFSLPQEKPPPSKEE
jgi:hypothetical protein